MIGFIPILSFLFFMAPCSFRPSFVLRFARKLCFGLDFFARFESELCTLSTVSTRSSGGPMPKVRSRAGTRVGRWGGGFVAMAAGAAVLLGGGAAARAQTAHFSGVVSTIGSGFGIPYGVAVDGEGDVFVADTSNNVVKEIVAVGGVVSSSSTVNTIGSGFTQPMGVAVDSGGDVFVADYGHSAVKEIIAVGGMVSSSSTVNTIGSGFSTPYGVAVDRSGDCCRG
jgi:hypothetical protein